MINSIPTNRQLPHFTAAESITAPGEWVVVDRDNREAAQCAGQINATETAARMNAEKVAGINFVSPLIAGLIAAISATCHEHGRQWEALRSLWNHKALKWEEFQWLEHLEIVLNQHASASRFSITPIPGASGWAEIVQLTNDSVSRAVKFEADRISHGLQTAFDMARTAA